MDLLHSITVDIFSDGIRAHLQHLRLVFLLHRPFALLENSFAIELLLTPISLPPSFVLQDLGRSYTLLLLQERLKRA